MRSKIKVRRSNPIFRVAAPSYENLDERIELARRIYQETGCKSNKTGRRLQALGLGARFGKIKEWVKDIQCSPRRHYRRNSLHQYNPVFRVEAPKSENLDERIEIARRIYQETECNRSETLRQLRALGIRTGRKKIKEWLDGIQCVTRVLHTTRYVEPDLKIAKAISLLSRWLKLGPELASKIYAQGRSEGIGRSTMDRAAYSLGVIRCSKRESGRFSGHWWSSSSDAQNIKNISCVDPLIKVVGKQWPKIKLLGPKITSPRRQTAVSMAKDLLNEWLIHGPKLASDIYARARDVNISRSTTDRAANILGVIRLSQRKNGRFIGHWWALSSD